MPSPACCNQPVSEAARPPRLPATAWSSEARAARRAPAAASPPGAARGARNSRQRKRIYSPECTTWTTSLRAEVLTSSTPLRKLPQNSWYCGMPRKLSAGTCAKASATSGSATARPGTAAGIRMWSLLRVSMALPTLAAKFGSAAARATCLRGPGPLALRRSSAVEGPRARRLPNGGAPPRPRPGTGLPVWRPSKNHPLAPPKPKMGAAAEGLRGSRGPPCRPPSGCCCRQASPEWRAAATKAPVCSACLQRSEGRRWGQAARAAADRRRARWGRTPGRVGQAAHAGCSGLIASSRMRAWSAVPVCLWAS
mmetsp:Transcript_140126/g.390666  ORF Transcript_140126/g.390666 Transcript_140126/m.390666 type:complete len:310 (+) Transcript_140126:317-1246(+)